MTYYTAPRLGSGTAADPYRPDVPAETSWVGHTNGVDYLIATPTDLPVKVGRTKQLPRPALELAANARGRAYDDVLTWRVG